MSYHDGYHMALLWELCLSMLQLKTQRLRKAKRFSGRGGMGRKRQMEKGPGMSDIGPRYSERQEAQGKAKLGQLRFWATVTYTIPKIWLQRTYLMFLELGETPGSVATPASLY